MAKGQAGEAAHRHANRQIETLDTAGTSTKISAATARLG